jgi:hypothetical protein
MEVTISGVVNGSACSDCDDLNGTYYLQYDGRRWSPGGGYNGHHCRWSYEFPSAICNVSELRLYASYYTDLFFDDIGFMLYQINGVYEEFLALWAATFDSNYEFDCSQQYSVTGYTGGSESVYPITDHSSGFTACDTSNATVTVKAVTT